MPNRILKESICTSETTDQLSDAEERFFTRLITQCDDYGRMDARPAILRARCFPLRLDSISDALILTWRTKLVEVGLISLYTVDERQYLEMVTWAKHQTVRAQRSKWPIPIAYDCEQMRADASTCSRNPIRESESLSESISISESCASAIAPNGAEIEAVKPEKKKRVKTESPEGFDEFWEAYPRKKARAAALQVYAKVLRSGVKPETLLAAAGNYSQECRLAGREWQFICFPTTFLNQGRYEDYHSPPDPTDFRRAPNLADRRQEVKNGQSAGSQGSDRPIANKYAAFGK